MRRTVLWACVAVFGLFALTPVSPGFAAPQSLDENTSRHGHHHHDHDHDHHGNHDDDGDHDDDDDHSSDDTGSADASAGTAASADASSDASADASSDGSADAGADASDGAASNAAVEGDSDADTGPVAAPIADLQTFLLPAWTGPGTRVIVEVIVRNVGPGSSSGHTLVFAPQSGTDRTVTAGPGCVARDDGGFACQGETLPAESTQTYRFTFDPAGETEAWPPFWSATVTGNEPDPTVENNRTTLELPDSTFVRIEPDVKTRVDDENEDGRASPGEPIETYVYLANTSEYPWENVHVSLSGTVWDARELEQTIAPGEATTVKFTGVVPDLGADASSGIEAQVSARAVGASVNGWSGTLMLMGPYATPNPFGPRGEQYLPTPSDRDGPPAVDLDEEREAAERIRDRQRPVRQSETAAAPAAAESIGPLADAGSAPAIGSSIAPDTDRAPLARTSDPSPANSTAKTAAPTWRPDAARAPGPDAIDSPSGTFASAWIDDLRAGSPLSRFQSVLALQGLVAFLIVGLYIGVARARSRRAQRTDA